MVNFGRRFHPEPGQNCTPVHTSVGSASSAANATVNLPNLAAGTYTVLVTPYYPATASAQLTLESAVGGALTPTSSGVGPTYTTTDAGQNAYFSFAGTAGSNVSFAITSLALVPSSVNYVVATVYQPSGAQLTYFFCYTSNPGCEQHLTNLPATGTYTVTVTSGQATMSFVATLSNDLTETLTTGKPATLSLAAMGQSSTAIFTLSSAQTVALNLSSITSTPASTSYFVYVYNSSGTSVGST